MKRRLSNRDSEDKNNKLLDIVHYKECLNDITRNMVESTDKNANKRRELLTTLKYGQVINNIHLDKIPLISKETNKFMSSSKFLNIDTLPFKSLEADANAAILSMSHIYSNKMNIVDAARLYTGMQLLDIFKIKELDISEFDNMIYLAKDRLYEMLDEVDFDSSLIDDSSKTIICDNIMNNSGYDNYDKFTILVYIGLVFINSHSTSVDSLVNRINSVLEVIGVSSLTPVVSILSMIDINASIKNVMLIQYNSNKNFIVKLKENKNIKVMIFNNMASFIYSINKLEIDTSRITHVINKVYTDAGVVGRYIYNDKVVYIDDIFSTVLANLILCNDSPDGYVPQNHQNIYNKFLYVAVTTLESDYLCSTTYKYIFNEYDEPLPYKTILTLLKLSTATNKPIIECIQDVIICKNVNVYNGCEYDGNTNSEYHMGELVYNCIGVDNLMRIYAELNVGDSFTRPSLCIMSNILRDSVSQLIALQNQIIIRAYHLYRTRRVSMRITRLLLILHNVGIQIKDDCNVVPDEIIHKLVAISQHDDIEIIIAETKKLGREILEK